MSCLSCNAPYTHITTYSVYTTYTTLNVNAVWDTIYYSSCSARRTRTHTLARPVLRLCAPCSAKHIHYTRMCGTRPAHIGGQHHRMTGGWGGDDACDSRYKFAVPELSTLPDAVYASLSPFGHHLSNHDPTTRRSIHPRICARAYNSERNSFQGSRARNADSSADSKLGAFGNMACNSGCIIFYTIVSGCVWRACVMLRACARE